MRKADALVLFGGAILAAGAFAPGARADEVTVRKLPPFPSVTVADVKDGAITYRLATGSLSTKPLRDVEKIDLAISAAFTKADKLQADPNTAADAVAAYDEAAKTLPTDWRARLVRYRRLQAAESAGLIDRAVWDWTASMDESPSRGVIELRPRLAARLTGAGAAISTLETKLKGAKNPAYQSAINGLLLELYQREGQNEKAAALAKELGASAPTPGTTPAVSDRDQLAALAVRIEQGQAAEALAEIEKRLDQYGEADLPRALLLAGKASVKMGESTSAADAKKKLLLAGAMNLMKVYAYYPRSAEAPEALLLAGQAHLLLQPPNPAAAGAAFQKVTQEYGSSPLAPSAKAALEKLKK